jgi:oligosaccharyltransferase complex subunit delta (ribophorin II)
LKAIGHLDLDLPEPPEKAPQPPPQPLDQNLRYGPKAEITHIFRVPEKLPPKELSHAFLGLTLFPLLGFLVGVSIILSDRDSGHLSINIDLLPSECN